MNPFSNNTPNLSSSEKIHNKRDAVIYKSEKQLFQSSKKYGNKNVKYYTNGSIKSMKSYTIQKSLSRGNVLCKDYDCNLCKGVANKKELSSIHMGNNVVSEYWGGSFFDGEFKQKISYPVINSDISGVWGGSLTDVPKADLYNAQLPGSDPSLNMHFGYINNLIKIPRNFDGTNIIIDPSNMLFPDGPCDTFKYLKHSYLKTYLVFTMAVPLTYDEPYMLPGSCNDPSYNLVVGNKFLLTGISGTGSNITIASGIVNSLCCVGTLELNNIYVDFYNQKTNPGIYGLFEVYVNLMNIGDFGLLSMLLNTSPDIPSNSLSEWSVPNASEWQCGFSRPNDNNYYINIAFVRKVDIIQGTINQTKHNTTRENYMSCLENGTRKIKFSKNTVQNNKVTDFYC